MDKKSIVLCCILLCIRIVYLCKQQNSSEDNKSTHICWWIYLRIFINYKFHFSISIFFINRLRYCKCGCREKRLCIYRLNGSHHSHGRLFRPGRLFGFLLFHHRRYVCSFPLIYFLILYGDIRRSKWCIRTNFGNIFTLWIACRWFKC